MITDQAKAFSQMTSHTLRGAGRRVGRYLRPDLLIASAMSNAPAALLLVPGELRTADPVLAQEFNNGIYSFGERRVDTGGASPFRLKKISSAQARNMAEDKAADEDWQRELHSFRWLRHMNSSHQGAGNSHAQGLVSDWIGQFGTPGKAVAWQPEIAARRLMSWLCHSVMIVEEADMMLYKQFLKSIGVHLRFLRANFADAREGLPRLQVRTALAYGALCVQLQRPARGTAAQRPHTELGTELARQIFADGGHVSRCASILPEILADLLPLRQAYAKLGIAPAAEMTGAIDRMMPAIRFYRHRDGSFARFNGVSGSKQDLIAAVLRYDDAMGEPALEASQSGYQRLVGGPTTLIMDVGKPPNGEHSINAHAGCLSFEMSSLRTSFIVNCGAPGISNEAVVAASRSTAAHSTATLHNTSSCRFYQAEMFKRYLGRRILSGPGRVSVERRQLEGYSQITARHDGYLRQFGIWHERILQLSDDGTQLFGRDRFFVNGGNPPAHLQKDDCAIRFHLHPSVKAEIDAQSGQIVIRANENQSWQFSCDGGAPVLEESIYLASPRGTVATSQIVINLNLSKTHQVNWRFEQTIGTRLQ